jgi:hypothetical protein
MKKILSLLIALIILMQPVLGAELSQKKADDKPVKKDVELEQKELKESQKEFKKSEFKYGDEKAKSKTDIKLKTEKRQNGLKISAENPGKGSKDKHDILIAVEDIPNFNYKNVRIDHYSDTGTLDARWIQEVNEVDGYVLIPDVEFSSIIVDGFTGTYTKTINNLNLSTVQSISQESGNVTSAYVSIPDALDGVQMDENNSADYPDGAVLIMPFTYGDGRNIVDNSTGTVSNVIIKDGAAEFNGVNSSIVVPHSDSLTNLTEMSVFFYIMDAKNYTGTNRYIYDAGYWVSDCGDLSMLDDDSNQIRFAVRNTTGSITSDNQEYTPNEAIFGGIVWDGERVNYYLNSPEPYLTESFIGVLGCNNVNLTIGRYALTNSQHLDTKVNYFCRFDRALSQSEITNLYTSVNGTAARSLPNGTWTPVIDGSATLPIDSTVSSIEVVGDGTYNVTTTTTFTEDTTLISESESNGILDISIYKEYVNNATSGYLEYEPVTTNFTYNLSMASSDPNATAITHNQTINVSTGQHAAGDSFYYNFTLSTLEAFNYTANWISKTDTKAVVEYSSSNSDVENDFYLEDMEKNTTFDFKYSNGTILVNATSDSDGYLKFDDVGGVTDTYKLINDTYTIEKQTSATTFVAVVFTGLSFVGLYFANRFRRR